MADRRVRQTRKDPDGDITALCNDGEPWSPQPTSAAIADIESGRHTYFVEDSAGRSDIIVVEDSTVSGGKYLRTSPNGLSSDNLDALPDPHLVRVAGGVFERRADGSIGQELDEVELTFTDAQGEDTAVSVDGGRYAVELPAGRYTVEAVSPGFGTERTVLIVTPDAQTSTLNLFLHAAYPALGALLPLRLETRFDAHRLRLRIVPDEVWFTRHDPEPSQAELDALAMYLAAQADTDEERAIAWGQFVRRHGGGRAVWLVNTFRDRFDAQGQLVGERPTVQGDEPRFPQLTGFPSQLEVWLARAGGEPERAATLDVDADRLLMDLPVPSASADAENGQESAGPPRWWESWDEAVAAGLATTIDLGTNANDIDVLYVVGVDGGDPATLFADHRDAGLLGLLDPGTPTATVDGAPAADRDPDPAAWAEVLDADGVAVSSQQRRVSEALTGDPDALGVLPDGDGEDAGPLVAALWPALWGHALRDVWGIGPAVDAAAGWAAEELAPEGPLPTLRVGAQPYGLLPVTSLGRWQPDHNDPATEAAMIPSLARLRAVWAQAAEQAGTAQDADADRLLDLLSLTPTSTAYRHRLAWPLETWFLSLLSVGYDVDWDTLSGQEAHNPLIAELGLAPERRYGARGWSQPLQLPLVVPEGREEAELGADLRTLAQHARTGPKSFQSSTTIGWHGLALDSLLCRLVVRSLQLALADIGRAQAGEEGGLLNDFAVSVDNWDGDVILRLTHSLSADDLDDEPTTADAFARVADAVEDLADLADRDIEALERMLRATLDCATHRIDPWIVGVASRRLHDITDMAPIAGETPRMRLGAYGWVDRPRPGVSGPTSTGLLQAPSEGQATTAAILRDRAVQDTQPDRWQVDVDSASARAAERLATQVRGGVHLTEALGAEVERAVGDPMAIEQLRTNFPIRTEHNGRRMCDGQAVLATSENNLGIEAEAIPSVQFAALRAAVDTYGDLLVAEAVYDVVEGRADTAAAAMDAAAALARPPGLDVLASNREGHAVSTSCVVVLPHVDPPQLTHDPDDDPDHDSELSPGWLADAAVAALLGDHFGPADTWRWHITHATGGTDEVTLADVGLEPVDALALPLADLQRLVTGPDLHGELVADDGSDRYRRAVGLLAAFGIGPAAPTDVADSDQPTPTDDTAAELRSRLKRLRTVAAALRDRLLSADTDDTARSALQAATRWGIAPAPPHADTGMVERAKRAGQRLAARLDQAPKDVDAADLDAHDLASAIAQLASATGHLTVLARLPRHTFPVGLQRDTGAVENDWLPTVAAVREPLARLDAAQLVEDGHDQPALQPWANRPGDVWQTTDLDDADSASRRLVVAYTTTGVALDEGDDDTHVAVGLIDRWSETIPGSHHATAAAFGFDAPASRAPQAILLAVTPIVGQPLDSPTVIDILAETRTLLRARMAGPADLTDVADLLPTALLPATGPNAVSLEPTSEGDQ